MRKKLGEILVEEGLVSKECVAEALSEAGGSRIGDVLLVKGVITEEKLYRAVAKQFNIEFFLLRDVSPDQEALKLVNPSAAKKYKCLPVKKVGGKLKVATSNPVNIVAAADLSLIAGVPVEYVIMSPKDITKAILRFYGESNGVKDTDNLTAVQIVDNIITQAIAEGCSDIHIETQDDSLRVRYRVDGLLQDVSTLDKELEQSVFSRIKVMSDLDISEKRLPQDGAMRFSSSIGVVDLRVSVIPAIFGEKVVMRLLSTDKTRLSLDKVGFSKDDRAKFEKMLSQSYGMILITGPTGSGKTTTLYSAVSHLHTPEKNICTVEDPVEFKVKGITQVHVNPKIGLDFSSVLRSFVRQDPDVILVGEIRDFETADIAVRSALTGHLVLSSLHTNDSASTITRLIEMGVESHLIAASVVGVVAQRLVRKLCSSCKVKATPMEDSVELLALGVSGGDFWRAVGCDRCHGEGYRGRLGIFEVMSTGEDIKTAIIKKASTAEIRSLAEERGTKSFLLDGVEKARMGLTTLKEVMRVAYTES